MRYVRTGLRGPAQLEEQVAHRARGLRQVFRGKHEVDRVGGSPATKLLQLRAIGNRQLPDRQAGSEPEVARGEAADVLRRRLVEEGDSGAQYVRRREVLARQQEARIADVRSATRHVQQGPPRAIARNAS